MAEKFYTVEPQAEFYLNGELAANTHEGIEAMGVQMVHGNGAKGFTWSDVKWERKGKYLNRTGKWNSNVLHGTVNELWKFNPVTGRSQMRRNELTAFPNEDEEALSAIKKTMVEFTRDANNKKSKGIAKRYYKPNATYIINGVKMQNIQDVWEKALGKDGPDGTWMGFRWHNENYEKIDDNVYKRTAEWTSPGGNGKEISKIWVYNPATKEAKLSRDEIITFSNEEPNATNDVEATTKEAQVTTGEAQATTEAEVTTATKGGMTQKIAETIIASAVKKSEELGVKMNIAVVDKGANLVGFIRMDDAWLGSVDIALKKAKTSAFFNMETGVIGGMSQPGGSLFNIEHSNKGLITFPGGVPIKNANGELIGAVGVSGSSVTNDHTVAKAAIKSQ